MLTIFQKFTAIVSKALQGTAKSMVLVFESIAEARLQRTLMETELYRGRYRHRSKSDDDLPLVT